jgi:diguanylate cyclase (GGDEF)-like protein/PAS domain S-box-containing protein
VANNKVAGKTKSATPARKSTTTGRKQIGRVRRENGFKLTEAQRMAQQLIETLPNPIFFKGTDGRYLGVNRAWEVYFATPREAFVGKTVYDLYPENPEIAQRLVADDQALWDHPGTRSYETTVTTPDGKEHDAIYYKATFTNREGVVAGLIGTIVDITERKRGEEALSAAKGQLEMLIQSSPLAIYTRDTNGLLTSWNVAAEKMYGWTGSEVIGKPLPSVPDEERASSDELRRRLLNGEAFIKQESRRRRRDGTTIYIDAFLSPLRDFSGKIAGIMTVAADITERRQAEIAVKESEERYRAVFQNAAVGITRVGLDGVLADFNQKFSDMLGYTRDELTGKAIKDITHPDDYGHGAGFRSALSRGGIKSATGEKRYLRKDGSIIWARRTMSTACDADGKPQYVISVVEDVTDRRQAGLRQTLEHAVTRLLSDADRSSGIISKVIQIIGEAFSCAYGAYWIQDQHAQVMACSETWSVPSAEIKEFAESNRQFRHPLNQSGGLFMRAWNSGEPVWVSDVTQDTEFRRASVAAKAGLKGAFAFPIRSGNDTLGVMEFFSHVSRPPDEALLLSTRAIGSQIGLFIARKQAEERIIRLAHYDELTGLANRNMFGQCLNHALARARRNGKLLAVLFIDLDRFKNINDTLGHDAGDRVLKEVAERLQGCLRASDTIGRLGGDEFVVLLEEMPQPVYCGTVAQKILATIAKPVTVGEQNFQLTASIGISAYPADGEDAQNLLKNADVAMYRAKEQGKNNYQFYSAQMNVHSLEHLEMESDLRRALERNEFLLHYQPKVDVVSGRITGMEALVRWQHPGKGLIPPLQFIPLAEETGLIVPIGEWVLKTACARNKSWHEQGLPPLRVAVNLSARQFAHEGLLQDVENILHETGLDPTLLELEITESLVMQNPARAVKRLNELKAMGIHLSIDDFGTGYSSLSNLKHFPIETLKIDRSFIRDLPADADDSAITLAILAMAHSLKLKVIAEGVETVEQLNFLRDHLCDEVQGYYFSKPLSELEFAALVKKNAAF